MAAILLGPFRIDSPLAVGGMGEVWRGVHPEQGVPVAVKVITNALARRATYLASFRDEVRAVAGLDHPGVVLVFDHGEVPLEAERLSGGRMLAGSPYLVMELASGGSMSTSNLIRTWADLKGALLDLLDALAHAHARGVVHRDLKPGNVLVSGPDDTRPGLKLADFGLAHAGDALGKRYRGASGTPRYMAPEQFHGRWRDYGPWTDLYALGCMAWEMAAGVSPFPETDYAVLRQAHLYDEPEPFAYSEGLPVTFDGWLHRLLEKDPHCRFACAADAAFALTRLPDPPGSATPLAIPRKRAAANLTVPLSLVGHGRSLPTQAWLAEGYGAAGFDEDIADDDALAAPPPVKLAPTRPPPLPPTWRHPEAPPPSPRLVGAGLGLWGLRTVALVGREQGRDQIWDALRDVALTSRARAVLLRGAPGVGKSRLAQWATERAAELGAARILAATHSPGAGSRGLGRMLARHTGCEGLSNEDTQNRLERILRRQGVAESWEWRALADWMSPSPEMHTSSPEERYAMLSRHLGRLDRPAIVLLDDLQWGRDALDFARWVLDAQDQTPSPVLLLLSARDEGLDAETAEALGGLSRDPKCRTLSLGPLPVETFRRLIEELLLLDRKLAREVRSRAHGNPMFAVQLVEDWVRRELLEVGRGGFRLKAGARAEIPDDLHSLWDGRVSELLQSEDERIALELAALLGGVIDEQEWRLALKEAGLDWPAALAEALVARRLVRLEPGGWSWSHPMLRESLERSVRDERRWSELHGACARMLASLHGVEERGIASRLGKHLVAAGRLRDALEPLRLGATQRYEGTDYPGAMSLLRLHARCCKELDLEPADDEVGQALLVRVRVLIGRGRLVDGETLAEQLVELHGSSTIGASALCEAAIAAFKRGALEVHELRTRRAVALARVLGDRKLEALGICQMARSASLKGRYRQAISLGRRAADIARAESDIRRLAEVKLLLGQAHGELGELDEAVALTLEARAGYEQVGSLLGRASALNSHADWERRRGNLVAAEEGYLEALDLLRKLGNPDTLEPCLNLGIVRLERAHYEGALEALRTGLQLAERGGRRAWAGIAHALLLPTSAALADWQSWDEHMAGIQRDLLGTGIVDGDVARALQLAGALAGRAAPSRARVVLELALEQWKGIGQPDQIEATRIALSRLD